jgi:hypothetical protein
LIITDESHKKAKEQAHLNRGNSKDLKLTDQQSVDSKLMTEE